MSAKQIRARLLTSVVQPPPIDLVKEQVVTFAELARRLPRRRGGRPTHVSTLHRWRQNGLNGVRLSALRCGAIWVTTVEAYQRFVDDLTRAASPTPFAPAAARHASSDQVDRALDKLGL